MITERQKKANNNVRDELAKLVNKELDFEGILVTFSHTDVSPDFMNIKVYVSCLPEGEIEKVFKLLKRSVSQLAKQLAINMRMKYIPKMTFLPDKGQDNYTQIENIIAKLHEEKGISKTNKET